MTSSCNHVLVATLNRLTTSCCNRHCHLKVCHLKHINEKQFMVQVQCSKGGLYIFRSDRTKTKLFFDRHIQNNKVISLPFSLKIHDLKLCSDDSFGIIYTI